MLAEARALTSIPRELVPPDVTGFTQLIDEHVQAPALTCGGCGDDRCFQIGGGNAHAKVHPPTIGQSAHDVRTVCQIPDDDLRTSRT